MSEQSIIVWDLETVPDLAAAARMLNLDDAAEADVRQALGEGLVSTKSRLAQPMLLTMWKVAEGFRANAVVFARVPRDCSQNDA